MGEYRAEAIVDAPLERTFEVFIDATRFSQWQAAALGAFEQTGPLTAPGSTVRIDHGPAMKRTMTILESEPPRRLRYRQQGAGLDDTTVVRFEPDGERTHVAMSSELRVAGGPIGMVLERLARSQSRTEYQRELDRFAAVVARRPVEPGLRTAMPDPSRLANRSTYGSRRPPRSRAGDASAGRRSGARSMPGSRR